MGLGKSHFVASPSPCLSVILAIILLYVPNATERLSLTSLGLVQILNINFKIERLSNGCRIYQEFAAYQNEQLKYLKVSKQLLALKPFFIFEFSYFNPSYQKQLDFFSLSSLTTFIFLYCTSYLSLPCKCKDLNFK